MIPPLGSCLTRLNMFFSHVQSLDDNSVAHSMIVLYLLVLDQLPADSNNFITFADFFDCLVCFVCFISFCLFNLNHFWCQRSDFQKVAIAHFTSNWSENTCSSWIIFIIDQDTAIAIEAQLCSIFTFNV